MTILPWKHGETLNHNLRNTYKNPKNYSNTQRIPPSQKKKRYEEVEGLGLDEFCVHPVELIQESFACTILYPDLLIHDNQESLLGDLR